VEVVEPMGAETEMIVKVGGERLTVVAHGRASPAPGSRVMLAPDASQAHVFDAATGQRL
jgi:multiple sugar transport system ATP-binding protein